MVGPRKSFCGALTNLPRSAQFPESSLHAPSLTPAPDPPVPSQPVHDLLVPLAKITNGPR